MGVYALGKILRTGSKSVLVPNMQDPKRTVRKYEMFEKNIV